MSQIELVMEELKQLPQAGVQQVAALVHQLRQAQAAGRRGALAETAGCMSPAEADAFQRSIDEHCERIDPDNPARFD